MSDENDWNFRDKAAIEIFAALLSKDSENAYDAVSNLMHGGKWRSDIDKQFAEAKMESYVRASYKIANIMRKVRLEVFS